MLNRSKRRDRTNAVGSLVIERLNSLGISRKVREHTAPLIWAEIVGPQVASATEVDRIADGVLYVSCRSATWSHELLYHRADILKRMNERLYSPRDPEPVVREIRFTNRGLRKNETPDTAPPLHPSREEVEDIEVTPVETAAIDQSLSAITDEGLRDRMRRARIADARLRHWRIENGWCPCPTCGDLAPPNFPYDGTVACVPCRMARRQGR